MQLGMLVSRRMKLQILIFLKALCPGYADNVFEMVYKPDAKEQSSQLRFLNN